MASIIVFLRLCPYTRSRNHARGVGGSETAPTNRDSNVRVQTVGAAERLQNAHDPQEIPRERQAARGSISNGSVPAVIHHYDRKLISKNY